MRAFLTLLTIAPVLAIGTVSCGDSPTIPPGDTAYVLSTMDGAAVPAAYDSVTWDAGERRFMFRLLGRSLELLSADSADYAQATDVVELLDDGDLLVWSFQCTSRRVAYRRAGDLLVLELPEGPAPGPIVMDTLEVAGRALLQWKREPPSFLHPEGRAWRLEYRPGTPADPVCA